jgi:hypothetical protein
MLSIYPLLLKGKYKPLIVSNANKALHFAFHETLNDLTKAKRILDPLSGPSPSLMGSRTEASYPKGMAAATESL